MKHSRANLFRMLFVTPYSIVIPSAAEASAVRPGSRTKVSVPLVPPPNRHPEGSASPIDRVTQRLWRGVEEPVLSVAEGTSAVLILSMQLGAFRPPKTDNKIRCDAHLMDRRRGRLCAKSAKSPRQSRTR